jgi:Cu+-exporting ATPase
MTAACYGDERQSEAETERKPSKKYFCPTCKDVESETPGNCSKCGSARSGSPTFHAAKKTIYTCPMHPQIEQDRPGNCPICGMTLEPKNVVNRTCQSFRPLGGGCR